MNKSFKPHLVSLEKGKKYAWCACGRSTNQPFCDGSHKGSGISPIVFKPKLDEEVLLCTCKATKLPPYCDGSHNNLDDGYAEAPLEEIEKFSKAVLVEKNATGKAKLDGGAYVLTPTQTLSEKPLPLISKKDGAQYISFYKIKINKSKSSFFNSPDGEIVLFITEGQGKIEIAGKLFEIEKEVGAFIKSGETFRIHSKNPLTIMAVVCPSGDIKVGVEPTSNFDGALKVRTQKVDHKKATIMGDRFFQVLVGEEMGSKEVTQFLGEVPKSRAAMHKHLYEEAIVILSGKGIIWTETKKAKFTKGDVIFLPKKQAHSLECTSENGLRLMGVFYPSGSPAINY